ncbi:PAS domain-containing protein [Deinococcus hohokamensis]|uniref:PAS domain-containing protein n=1 Tax=Deinococcus hohokamensis TaxID=309883 RepID=A0ABV9I7F2_9DEIO
MDPHSLIEEVNQTASTMLGLQRPRLTGRRFSLFVIPKYRVHFSARLKRTMEEPDQRNIELLTRPDGSTFWTHLEGRAFCKDSYSGARCRVTVLNLSV